MDTRAVASACEAFILSRDLRRVRGSLGQVKGTGVGASVEFHDYRRYLPGDDPRHVDWAVYGRTGELNVRLFSEEVHPSVEVLLDDSRSMALADGRKQALSRELAAFMTQSARLQGSRAQLYSCGHDIERCESADAARQEARDSVLLSDPMRCAQRLRAGGMRVLISDFMSTQPPARTLATLSRGAAQLVVIMTLGPWEAAPDAASLATLADVETEDTLSTALGQRALQRYLLRLEGIRKAVEDACRALGGVFVHVVCDRGLVEVLRAELLPQGVVLPT